MADEVPRRTRGPLDPRAQASWLRWWTGVTRACGPPTGARTVFDLVAAPLFARLGFQARDLAPAPADWPRGW